MRANQVKLKIVNVLSFCLFAAGLFVTTNPIYASDDHGENQKARVYLIQGKGSTRHVFADEQWLGAVDKDSYTFSDVDPGEYLIWTDKADFEWLYLSSAKIYYLEVTRKSITVLDETAGKMRIEQVGAYRATTDRDRRQSVKKAWKYGWVRRHAAASGTFDPCRFIDEKEADYKKQALVGDSEAQHNLARMYWTGDCVAQDRTVALNWYRQAAEQGHGLSAFLLGNIYARGLGVSEDLTEAARWYRIAAVQGTDVVQGYAKQWLSESDPEYQEAKRREAEAKARVEAEQKKLNEARRQRRQRQRLARVENQYGRLGLVVIPVEEEARLEEPRRKKPVEKVKKNSGDNGIAYMLPPEFALGVLAAGWILGVIETAMESKLSSDDKEKIQDATDKLSQALLNKVIARDLSQRIVASGELPKGGSLYKAMDPSIGLARDEKQTTVFPEISTVLEVQTAGVGLVVTDKQYRPAQFLMSNAVRLIRREDGAVLKDATICYASTDTPNFSDWAMDGQKRLRAELESAFAYTAEEILQLLAGDVDVTSSARVDACAELNEAVLLDGVRTFESGRR